MISIFDFLNLYCLLVCVFALLWYYSQSTYDFWRKLNVKYVKPIPFFGNTAKIAFHLDSVQRVYNNLYERLGDEPYGGVFHLRSPELLIKDPDLVSTILAKDFNHFYDRGIFLFRTFNEKLNPLSMHLFFEKGERWRILRHKMSPIFAPGKVKNMHDQVMDCVGLLNAFVDRQMCDADEARHSSDVELQGLFDRLTIDVIGSCAFGIDCQSLKSSDVFSKMAREALKINVAHYFFNLILSMISERFLNVFHVVERKTEMTNFFLNFPLEIVEYRRRNGVRRNDALQSLMDLQNSHKNPKFAVHMCGEKVPKNEKFNEFDITVNAFLFFIAGFDTITLTLSFCLYELALNENIQQKLRSECQLVKNKCKNYNYDSFKDMPYLKAVITETLRKYPPMAILRRKCTEDYVIPGTKTQIPAGTNVVIPVWSIHHDWRNYQNPEVFDPDRFLGDQKNTGPSGAYLPFGGGPKYCLGKHFAEMELKSVLSDIILRYNFKPCTKTEIPITYKKGPLFQFTKSGIWVNMTKKKI